jgi:TPR repeat protein
MNFRGVRRHPEQALHRFNEATENGYKPAMHGLADIYEKGLPGAKPDPKRAAQWREKAEKN